LIVDKTLLLIFTDILFFIILTNDRDYEHWRLAGDSFSNNYKVKARENTANCDAAAIVS